MTAAGEMRRSATWTPVDVRPEISARWIMRQASADARLATTRSPRRRAVPSAAASRTAVSGVRSTFTSPVAPSRPNGELAARVSQTTFSWIWAPVSISLNG